MTQLETSRLILRPWCDSDAQALYRWARDRRWAPPPVGRLTPPWKTAGRSSAPCCPRRAPLRCCSRAATAVPSAPWVCFPRRYRWGRESRQIGYWIAHPYWGQGLVPEAVEELLRWQFQEMGVQRVWCAHSPENEKSRRVQKKCGFRHVCDTPPIAVARRTERPGVCQAITRQEWEVRHGG